MSIINTNAKEIHCKVLYCGPEHSGKKSSLLYIRDQFKENKKSFFNIPLQKEIYCLVLYIGKIFSFKTFFHVYNLNNESIQDNKNLLEGVDGLVFVASSLLEDREKNNASFLELENFFKERNKDLFKLPMVIQYNKRDLKSVQSIKALRKDLNKYNNKDFESSALTGKSILEPLKYLCKLILSDLKKGGF